MAIRRSPEVEASVRESLGVAYRRRSMFAEAEPNLRRSLEIRRELFGDDHPVTASSYTALANLLFEHEGRIDDSLALLVRALDVYDSHGLAGAEAEAWLQLDVGNVHLAGDRLAEAERAFRRCRELLARYRGPEHPDLSRPVRGLALVALARDEPGRGRAPRAPGRRALYGGGRGVHPRARGDRARAGVDRGGPVRGRE